MDTSIEVQEALKNATTWEKLYIEYMKNWTANESNTKYMDVAFNAERAIGDELERETYGDIVTIALSYIFMFVYITFSLGRMTKWSRFMVNIHNYYYDTLPEHVLSHQHICKRSLYLNIFFRSKAKSLLV